MSNMYAETFFDIDVSEWNKKICEQNFSTAYQMAGFYDPHKLAFDSKQFYIFVKNDLDQIVGQLTGVIHFKDFWSDTDTPDQISDSMIVWNYGPIIHDFTESDEILRLILSEIDKIAISNKINIIKGASPPLSKQFSNEIFRNFQYSCTPWITNIIHFSQNSDEFFLQLHNKTRYDIRKGEKNGLTFEIANNRDSLEKYSELKFRDRKNGEDIIKRNKIFRDHRWNSSIKNNYEKVYFARLNGELIAGMGNFVFNKNVTQNTIANSTEKNFYAGSFLTWNAIKWSIENNFLTYDMGGSNPVPISDKERGIKHYKAKWKGKEYEYTIYIKTFNKRKRQLSKVIKQPSQLSKKFSKLINK